MIKKRIAALAATVAVIAASAAIPVFASIYGYYEFGAQT